MNYNITKDECYRPPKANIGGISSVRKEKPRLAMKEKPKRNITSESPFFPFISLNPQTSRLSSPENRMTSIPGYFIPNLLGATQEYMKTWKHTEKRNYYALRISIHRHLKPTESCSLWGNSVGIRLLGYRTSGEHKAITQYWGCVLDLLLRSLLCLTLLVVSL